MTVLVTYAIAVFAFCFILIRSLHLKLSASLVVGLCVVLGPLIMQGLNILVVGYLDPFWLWAAIVQAAIALACSVTALGVCAAIESAEAKSLQADDSPPNTSLERTREG